MKKKLVLGMVLMCGFQMAYAAPTARPEAVRKAIETEVARAKAAGEIRATDASHDARLGNTLARISGSAEGELRAALSRTIEVKEATGSRNVPLREIGNLLAKADEVSRAQGNPPAMERAIKVSSAFLALANRDPKNSGLVMTEQQKLELDAFNKQLSLIPEIITKMDPADMEAHIKVMEKAIEKRVTPNMNGDQAFASALKEGKTQEEYKQKLTDLTGCVR